MEKSLVSVIVPCYNQGEYLEKSIKSVLAQTYQNFEIIVINDCSTDNTRKICQDYENRISYLENEKNLGPAGSRNRGLHLAKGEFVALLDSDDIMLPRRLELGITEFKKNDNLGLIYGDADIIDQNDKKLCESPSPPFKLSTLLQKNIIKSGSTMFRRNVLDKVGFFDEKIRCAEDWDLWIRIAKQSQVKRIPNKVYKLRYREESLCWSSIKTGYMAACINYVKRKHTIGVISFIKNFFNFKNEQPVYRKFKESDQK